MRRILKFILLFAVTLGGIASPSLAAITFVQGNFSATATVTSQATAFTANNTAGNWIAVCLCWNDITSTESISDTNANIYTKFGSSPLQIGTNNRLTCWYAENIAGGANTVTTSISGLAVRMNSTIHEYSGVATSASVDIQSTGTTGTGTAVTSGSLTTTNANDLLFANVGRNATGGTYTAGANYTLRQPSNCATVTSKECSEDQVVSVTGAYTATYTTDAVNTNWGVLFVSFKAAAAAAAPCVNFITLLGAGCK